MNQNITTLLGDKEIGLSFTDKPVTPWGGMVLFSGLAREVGLEGVLRESLAFRLRSPNATDPVEIYLTRSQIEVLISRDSRASRLRIHWGYLVF